MKSTFLAKLRSVFKRDHFRNQKGLGTIEMVVLLAVLITLAVAFKTFATGYLNKKTDEIEKMQTYQPTLTQTHQIAALYSLDNICL